MKRFLFLFIPLALLVMAVTIGIGFSLNRSAVASLKEHELGYLTTGSEQLLYHLETPIQQLQGFFREPDVTAALQQQDGHARSAMAQILLAMMYRNPVYDQVRWLSAAGQEVVRINNTPSGPVIVAQTELQDKSDRNYYREAVRLHPGQIYVSQLDLNVEHNQVEVPHKPTLRMALRLPPVAGRDQGLLVINMNARHFLNHLRQNIPPGHEQHPMLLNQAGYWLLSSRPEDAWGFMLGRDTTMSRRHPAEWSRMSVKPSGELETASGLWFWTTVDVARLNPAEIKTAEQWKLATHVTAEEILHLQWQQWRDLLSMALLTLGLLAVGLYYYLRLLIEKEQTAARLELVTARQEAEALLAASEERLRFALTASETGTWSLDVASGTVFRSEQHDRIFGYDGPVIDWDHDLFLSHVLPDDRPQLAADIKNAVETMAAWTLECRIRRVDGAVRWIGIIGRSQVDGEGRVVRQDGIIRDITERKLVEEALRQSETKFHSLFDNIQEMVSVYEVERDSSGQISERRLREGNPAFLRGVGASDIEEVRGKTCCEVFGEAWSNSHLPEVREAMASGQSRQLEVYHSGIGRHFITTIVPLDNDAYLGSAYDITALKKAQESLTEALNKAKWLAQIPDENPSPVVRVSIAGTVLYCNPSARTGWNCAAGEPLPGSLSTVLLNRAESDQSAQIELIEGSCCYLVYVRSFAKEGYINIYGIDITARRQAEESLRKSETLLRLIMDYSTDVIFIKDLESRYLMVNPTLEHLVGKSSSELLGTTPTHLFSDPAIGSHLMEHDSHVIREGKAEVFEEILDTTLGRRIFETTKSPWYDEHGNIAGTVGISRDITENKQIEQELFLAKQAAESANLAKSEFLTVMSHELRTPLATILGFTEILTEGLQGPLLPDQHKFIATIEESARHLLELINDILDLAKVEAGKVEVHYEACWLREVCEASLRFIKEPAHKKGIGTRQQFEAPDTLVTDVRLLKQVLINLLANAVKFTSAGGIIELTVAADLTRKEIQFVVKDTGIGISPEDQARLFAPFMQVDSDLTRKNQGTGLGLALSSRLATVLGGSLTVESTLGVGSRFILTLPLISGAQEKQATDHPLAAPEPEPATGVAPLILIVDDVPDNLLITDTILNNAGYRTVTVTDGAVAVATVTSHQPAAVLMDIQMPGIDGLQAIRQIRALPPPLSATPIIAVTALAMPEDRERCLAAGADDYVTKPVRLKELCRQLGHLLSRNGSEPNR